MIKIANDILTMPLELPVSIHNPDNDGLIHIKISLQNFILLRIWNQRLYLLLFSDQNELCHMYINLNKKIKFHYKWTQNYFD